MVTVDKPGNAMHGNVWEWCSDWGGSGLSGGTDPVGPEAGSYRVLRGGCFGNPSDRSRSGFRHPEGIPSFRFGDLGFRVARSQLAQ